MAQQARAHVEAAPRVATQVQDQTVHAHFLEASHVLLDGVDDRGLRKATQAQIADVILQQALPYELQVDLRSLYLERQRRRVVAAVDHEVHGRAGRTTHQAGHLVDR